MKKNQHVVPYKKDGITKWAIISEGAKRHSVVVDTQSEAVSQAKGTAKRNSSELLIHGRDGLIRERNSYGKDKFPPKG